MSGRETGGRATEAAGTLGRRLAAARRRAFVGRAGEIDLFRAALTEQPPPFAVLFLHGPGGIGKTSLLRRLADEAETSGWVTALVDCRTAGSPPTLLAQIAVALGLPPEADPLPALHAGPRTVLLLDTYETADALDGWLRDSLLPDLPEGALVVIAGRGRPPAEWRTDPSWHDLLRVVALRNLDPADASALLSARGVPVVHHERVLETTGGHPLALSLLADVVAQTGALPEEDVRPPDVVATLLERFVSDVPSPLHSEALQVCAHARYTTEALLAAVVPDADPGELFRWLRSLSFIESSPDGLLPHDLAREVLDMDLRWRDEARYVDLHVRIRNHVTYQLRAARGTEQERLMRESMYLHRANPLLGPYLSWQEGAATARSLRTTDVEEVEALAAELEGRESAEVVRFWASRHPDAFLAFERPGEELMSGFAAVLRLTEPARDELAADPVVTALIDWVRATAPLRRGDRISVGRHMLFRHAYGRPCPEMDIVQTRSCLQWLNDDALAWAFVVVPEDVARFWEPEFNYIDMPLVPGLEVAMGDRTWVAFGRDWRASPPDAWLELMAHRELDMDLDLTQLATQRPVPLVVLSHPEFSAAVRAALREASRPEALARNPLARSRVVAEAGDGDRGEVLADLLVAAVDALRGSEQGDRLHRAVAATFFKGAATQEAAAQRLGLPFSTYRRHLAAGIEQVTGWLWQRELHGVEP